MYNCRRVALWLQNNCVMYTHPASNNCHYQEPRTVTFTAAIVTNCTQRKSGKVQIDMTTLPRVRGVAQLAALWTRHVDRASPVGPVQTLYQGRSIADAAASASQLSSSWYVVSAGLGLVRSDEPVPAYECTVAVGSELSDRLERSGATTADWWNAITAAEPRPLSRLIAKGTTLLALPSTYLRMVHDDLAHLSTAKAKHLRIFTSTAGARIVPGHLADCVMPYDDRLESVPGYAGTRTDFAQRALRHFVEKLVAAELAIAEARAKVTSALARCPRPLRSPGKRMSDDEIRQTLTAQWTQHAGSSTRLLRYLRDEARISCEQKRFSRIWQALAAELRT